MVKLKFTRGAKSYFKTLCKDHPHDYMIKYCQAVLNERLMVCEKIYNAVIKQINDLYKARADDYPYYFNFEKSKAITDFAMCLPEVELGKPVSLPLFKGFIFAMIEGWRIKRNDGTRFRRVFLSMARSNGKTDIASVLALRDFLAGKPDNSRQIIIASSTTDKTAQLFGYVRKRWHVASDPHSPYGFLADFKDMVEDNQLNMRIDEQNTRLWKKTAGGSTADSAHPTLAIFDEYHELKSSDFIDSITSGNIQNQNARLIIISTAGTDPNVPMYHDYNGYSTQLEKGKLDDRLLFLVWEQDSDKETFKPDTWIKSNPLMELPEKKLDLTDGMVVERDSKSMSGELPKFIVKNMNRWQNAKSDAFIPLDVLRKAQRPLADLPPIDGRDVFVGFDFSLSSDDTGVAFVYPLEDGQFMVQQFSFIPTKMAGGIQAKEKQDGINYTNAEKHGFCKIMRNRFGTVNQDEVYTWFLDYVDAHWLNVRFLGYDAYNAGTFIKSIDQYQPQWPCVAIRQGAISLSEPTKFLQTGMLEGKILVPKEDKILEACLNNAVLTDRDNMLLVDKNKKTAKIDCVDAIVDALFEGMYYFTDFTQIKPAKNPAEQLEKMSAEERGNYYSSYFG